MLITPFLKALYWLCFIFCIGMAQFFLTWVFHFFTSEDDFNYTEFLTNGFYLFLCISATAAITYEFFLDNIVDIPRLLAFTIGALSVVIIISAMLFYSIIYIKPNLIVFNGKEHIFVRCEEVLLLLSLLVSFALKYLIYHHKVTLKAFEKS